MADAAAASICALMIRRGSGRRSAQSAGSRKAATSAGIGTMSIALPRTPGPRVPFMISGSRGTGGPSCPRPRSRKRGATACIARDAEGGTASRPPIAGRRSIPAFDYRLRFYLVGNNSPAREEDRRRRSRTEGRRPRTRARPGNRSSSPSWYSLRRVADGVERIVSRVTLGGRSASRRCPRVVVTRTGRILMRDDDEPASRAGSPLTATPMQ